MTFLCTYGVDAIIFVNHLKYATPTEFDAGTWVPVITGTGDIRVSKDDAASANIAAAPTYIATKGWRYTVSAAELTCQRLVVRIADAATKVICDDMFIIETIGHASAKWPPYDSTNLMPSDAVALSGDQTAAANLEAAFDGGTYSSGLLVDLKPGAIEAVREALEPESGILASGTTNTATLPAEAPTRATNYYRDRGAIIKIYRGTGAGQQRPITGDAGKVLTVAAPFDIPPDSTSYYEIF